MGFAGSMIQGVGNAVTSGAIGGSKVSSGSSPVKSSSGIANITSGPKSRDTSSVGESMMAGMTAPLQKMGSFGSGNYASLVNEVLNKGSVNNRQTSGSGINTFGMNSDPGVTAMSNSFGIQNNNFDTSDMNNNSSSSSGLALSNPAGISSMNNTSNMNREAYSGLTDYAQYLN